MDLHDQRYLTCITYGQLQPGIAEVEHKVHTGWSVLDALNFLFLVPPDVFIKDIAGAQGHRQYIKSASITDLVDGMHILQTVHLPQGNGAFENEMVGLLVSPYGQALLPALDGRPVEEQDDVIVPLLIKLPGRDFVTPTDKYYTLSAELQDKLYDDTVPLTPQAYLTTYKGVRLDGARVEGDKVIYPDLLSHHLFATAPEAIMHFLTQAPDKFDRNAASEQHLPEYFSAGGIVRNGEIDKGDLATSAQMTQLRRADGEELLFSMCLLFRQDVLPTLEKIGFQPAVVNPDADGYLLEFLRYENGKMVLADDTLDILDHQARNRVVPQTYPFISTLKIADRAIAVPTGGADTSYDVHFHVYTGDFNVALQLIISHTFSRLLDPNAIIDGQPRWGVDGQIRDEHGQTLVVITEKQQDPVFQHRGIYIGISQSAEMKSLLDPQWAAMLAQGNKGAGVTDQGLHYEMIARMSDGKMTTTLGLHKFNAVTAGNFLVAQALQRPELSMRRNEMVGADEKYALQYDWELTFGNGQPAMPLTSFSGMGDEHISAFLLIHVIPNDYFLQQQIGKQDIGLRLTDLHFIRTEDMKKLVSKGKYNPQTEGFEFGGDPAHMDAGVRSGYYLLKEYYKKAPHRLAPEPPFQNRRPRRPGEDGGEQRTPSQGI